MDGTVSPPVRVRIAEFLRESSEEGLSDFSAFMRETHREESLMFYNDVGRYREIDTDFHRQTEAARMYRTYVQQTGKLALNISNASIQAIDDAYLPVTRDTFLAAEEEIAQILNQSALTPYLLSKRYATLVRGRGDSDARERDESPLPLESLTFDAEVHLSPVSVRRSHSDVVPLPTKSQIPQRARASTSTSALPYYDSLTVKVQTVQGSVSVVASGRMLCSDFVAKIADDVNSWKSDRKLSEEERLLPFGIWIETQCAWMDEGKTLNHYAHLFRNIPAGGGKAFASAILVFRRRKRPLASD